MNELYDVAIIGAGSAGMNSALYLSRSGMKVALIERGLYGGTLHDTAELENYLGFSNVGGFELAEKMEEQVRTQDSITHIYGDVQGVEDIGSEPVCGLNGVKLFSEGHSLFKVDLGKNHVFSKVVVIATGVKHKKLGVKGENEFAGRGVSYCAVCDSGFFKGKHVAVIGGGNSALDEALYLSNVVGKVTIIHRRDELSADVVLQERAFEKDNIEVKWNAEVNEFIGSGSVDALNLRVNGGNIDFNVNGAFIYIGVNPVTEPFQNLPILDEEGYVITNSKMETQVKGVYAIGDVRRDSIRQVATAVGDGAVASDSIVEYLRGLD